MNSIYIKTNNMDTNKKIKSVLDNFIDPENQNEVENKLRKKIIIDEREGLIERCDRIILTSSGKQLLREQY